MIIGLEVKGERWDESGDASSVDYPIEKRIETSGVSFCKPFWAEPDFLVDIKTQGKASKSIPLQVFLKSTQQYFKFIRQHCNKLWQVLRSNGNPVQLISSWAQQGTSKHTPKIESQVTDGANKNFKVTFVHLEIRSFLTDSFYLYWTWSQ